MTMTLKRYQVKIIYKGAEAMEVIAVINQKGGVGKSTTALALGAGLSLKGYKVLFIDLDAQGNLSYTLGASIQGYNAMGVLQRPETIKEEIQHTGQANIIASSTALAGADTLLTETGKEYRLKEALERVKADYDYCIIDTPPALGILTVNALTACKGAVIPAQADIYSLQGIGQLNSTLEAVRKYCNDSFTLKGIVLTRFNKRAVLSRDVADLLEETAKTLNTKLYKTHIRENISIKEAQIQKQSIYKYAPSSNASKDYMELVKEVFNV